MDALHITIIQSRLHWEDKAANLAMFDQKVAGLAGKSDLLILPEMFTTGFSMRASELAESMEGPTMRWMAEKATALQMVVTGSFIAEENGRYFNRLVWMRPDQTWSIYDKRHLFTLAKEEEHYSAGQDHLIVQCKEWTIMPLICYDLRFPVWSRNVSDYDVLLYIANWPSPRANAWKTLLRARAIENQCYVIGVNRVGEDPKGNIYTGDSMVVDFAGEQRWSLKHNEDVHHLELTHQPMEVFRSKFAFLKDRDQFSIGK